MTLRPQSGALAAVLAGFFAAFLGAACGPKSFAVGSVPFPAPKAVIVDAMGQPRSGLPETPEPFRLILLDYLWCPPCADAWEAIREASREIPEGSVRVYRVVFDRERLLDREGTAEVAPLRQPVRPNPGDLPVTTVVAIPRSFGEQFAPGQAPILLLTDRAGKVLKRWTGASPSLSDAIVSEVNRLSSAPPLPET
ncbi:MAG TPA: hypothetical protein VK863_02995 [Candidatus Limnocylindrales bacterium]|nr:hypothetical protein [Candidatus Limnocylindrales bacterium]